MPKWMHGDVRVPFGEFGEHPRRVREHEALVVGDG